MNLWHPYPCGHFTRSRGCGGCDPSAVEWVKDDGGPWRPVITEADIRRVFAPLTRWERARLTFLNWRLRMLLRWDERRGWR